MISARYLEQGTALALEQSGYLLADAAALYRQGSYATSLALAQFGREELGRYRIFLDLRAKINAGTPLDLDALLSVGGNHLAKQRRSQVGGVTFRPSPAEGLGRAIQSIVGSRPDSDQYQHAAETADAAAQAKLGRLPNLRHEARLAALYVDPSRDGKTWNRPRDTTREQTYQAIQDLFNDYASAFNRLQKDEPGLLALVPRIPRPEVGLLDPL